MKWECLSPNCCCWLTWGGRDRARDWDVPQLGLVSPHYEVLSVVEGWTPPSPTLLPAQRERNQPQYPSFPPPSLHGLGWKRGGTGLSPSPGYQFCTLGTLPLPATTPGTQQLLRKYSSQPHPTSPVKKGPRGEFSEKVSFISLK